MSKQPIARRTFLKYAGGAAVGAGALGLLPKWKGGVLTPEEASAAIGDDPDMYLGGTDGWIHLPPDPIIRTLDNGDQAHPDKIIYDPGNGVDLTTYIFGFRVLSGLTSDQIIQQKNKAQHSAPLFWVPEFDPTDPKEFRVKVTNIGLALRPDLFDAHTLHWHGFRNVIPFFDGEPSGSVAVMTNREFTYVYKPRDPGTYMYHCHVEDTEHVHMGMTGLVFVQPKQNGTPHGGYDKFLYNDGDGSTGYNREFAMFLSEVWAESHWADSHLQLPEWSDYRADFSMINGRVYPDTTLPNAPEPATLSDGVTPFTKAGWDRHYLPVATDSTGDLVPVSGEQRLQYQPQSSLVTCQPGERVALRFANLGFREQAMTIDGIQMRVVGRDATLLRGRDGTNGSYETDTINIGPGESYDVLFTAPAHSGGSGHDTYLLYNRAYDRSNNLASSGFGGQATEIHVYPSGDLDLQYYPNDLGM